MIVLIAIIVPALGSYQAIPLGDRSISLDFEGHNITVLPMEQEYDDCVGVTTYYAKLMDNGTGNPSWVYLFISDIPHPASDLKKELKEVMRAICGDDITLDPRDKGYISAGMDSDRGQEVWGSITPLDMEGGRFTARVEVIAAFQSGTLNEHVVKTARI